jgi:tetratricopeptide (TPR) repeat protein
LEEGIPRLRDPDEAKIKKARGSNWRENISSEEFVNCPICGVGLKLKRMFEHLNRFHPEIPPLDQWHDREEGVEFCDALVELASMMLEEGEHEAAVEVLEKVPEGYPGMAAVWCYRGIVLQELGEPEESLQYFKRAVELDDKCPEYWYNLGSAYIQVGGPLSEALKCTKRALGLNPDREVKENAEKLIGGIMEAVEKELERKESMSVETWLELDEHFHQGIEHVREERLDLAEKEFSYVVSVDKCSEKALGNLGLVHMLKGKFDEAERCFQRALEINPTYPLALENLARLKEIKASPGNLAELRKRVVFKHY